MEFLSHLPSTSPSANPLRPTLFELIAQDQLRDLIQPALRYLISVGSLSPMSADFSFTLNATHGIFLNLWFGTMRYMQDLCSLWIDIFLSHMVVPIWEFDWFWGGSFTENFYGLKRERMVACPPLSWTATRVPDKVSQRTKLRTVDIYKSLFMLVVRPPWLVIETSGWSPVHEIQTWRSIWDSLWRDTILFNKYSSVPTSGYSNW